MIVKESVLKGRDANMSYRMKRVLLLLVTGLFMSLSAVTSTASAQTGGSFFDPYNSYNSGLWKKQMVILMEICLTALGVRITYQ